jgi:tight adherence protein B
MRNVLIFLCSIVAIAAVEGTRQLLRWSRERRDAELRRRLQAVVGGTEPGGATLLRDRRFASSAAMDAFLREIPLARRIEKLLEQADSRLTVAQFLLWTAVAVCAGLALGTILRLGLVVAVALALAGVVLPLAALVLARTRRSNRLSEQLPEALEMMSRSLRAGHALTSAFEVVATEMPEPISIEFARAFEAQRLGIAVEQAIVQMTERAPGNRDLKIFAVSAVIQRETGGNLAELLGNIAETIRARYRFYGKLRALTAEGRASGVILGMLPLGMALLLRIVNPKYVTPLVSTPTGHLILAFAILMWLGGIVWLVKLTQVDV